MWSLATFSLFAHLVMPVSAADTSLANKSQSGAVDISSTDFRVSSAKPSSFSSLSNARSLSENKASFDGGVINTEKGLEGIGTGSGISFVHGDSSVHAQAETPTVKKSNLSIPTPKSVGGSETASPVKTEEGFTSYFNESLSEMSRLIGDAQESQSPEPTFLHRMDLENPPLIDRKASHGLVATIIGDAVGFTGHCYQYVLEALVKSGIVPSFKADPTQTHAAYQFDEFVKHHQALHGRQFKEIDPNTRPLPIGSIIVWAPGEGKFSRYAGHIEIVVSNNPPQACSDGCERVNMGLLSQAAQDSKVKLYIISR